MQFSMEIFFLSRKLYPFLVNTLFFIIFGLIKIHQVSDPHAFVLTCASLQI